MVYFIHDITARAIKIGSAREPRKRLSTLQISTSNKLVMLGAIGGTERIEKKIHALVWKHCAPKPDESLARPLCIHGEWFDDRILPFVIELMKSPKDFLDAGKKKIDKPGRANRDPSLHQSSITLTFDSGETYCESFVLSASSPALALAAVGDIANARLAFLAHMVRITELTVAGAATRKVNLQGAVVTQCCEPREGFSVILNSEPGNGRTTIGGVKQYSNRWLHGVPAEFCKQDYAWDGVRPTGRFQTLLHQFAHVLIRNQCVISAITPLSVRGIIPRELCLLPKGELRSKANKVAASRRKQQRPPEQKARPKDGIVYFIQDKVTLAVKIGFCLKNPEKRLAALQTGNSNALSLLGHIPGSIFHEKALHARFFRCHLQGEWFSNAIISDIEAILKYPSMEEWMNTQDSALSSQAVPVGDVGPVDPI